MNISFWICAIVTAASAFTSLGFSLAAYFKSDKKSQSNAMYTTARSTALAAICVVPFFNKSPSWLIAAATLMIIVQFIDTLIGIRLRELLPAIGPAILVLLNLTTLIWFLN